MNAISEKINVLLDKVNNRIEINLKPPTCSASNVMLLITAKKDYAKDKQSVDFMLKTINGNGVGNIYTTSLPNIGQWVCLNKSEGFEKYDTLTPEFLDIKLHENSLDIELTVEVWCGTEEDTKAYCGKIFGTHLPSI